LTSAYLSKSK